MQHLLVFSGMYLAPECAQYFYGVYASLLYKTFSNWLVGPSCILLINLKNLKKLHIYR